MSSNNNNNNNKKNIINNNKNVKVIPPFLEKTYAMVSDPSTDDIVSWSNTGKSFVVWKVVEFSHVLLCHFNHNNLSSFVRQLHTYGFRKLDPERFEYGNERFIKGQNSLLQGIRRRKSMSSQSHKKPRQIGEGEEVVMQQEKGALVLELEKLIKYQQDMENIIRSLQDCVLFMEKRQHILLQFLGTKNSNFSVNSIDFDAHFALANNILLGALEEDEEEGSEYIKDALNSPIGGSIEFEISHNDDASSSFEENGTNEDRDNKEGTTSKCLGDNNDFWEGLLKETIDRSMC